MYLARLCAAFLFGECAAGGADFARSRPGAAFWRMLTLLATRRARWATQNGPSQA